jgi:hypothetical protein
MDGRTYHVRGVAAEQAILALPGDARLDLPLRVAVEEDVERHARLHERGLDPVRAIVDREHRGERAVRENGEGRDQVEQYP